MFRGVFCLLKTRYWYCTEYFLFGIRVSASVIHTVLQMPGLVRPHSICLSEQVTPAPSTSATYPARRSSRYGLFGEAEERFETQTTAQQTHNCALVSTERRISFFCLICRLEPASPPVSLTLWVTFARWPLRRES